MAVYRYIRFSTDKQDEQSKRDIIAKYCDARGIAQQYIIINTK